jgi:hypothetical protein
MGGGRRGVYSILEGKPEGKIPLGRPRHRWKGNIKKDLQELGCEGIDCIELAQDRVPQNAGNFLTSWKPVSFSRRTLLHGVSK